MGIRTFELDVNSAIEMGWTFMPLSMEKYFGTSAYLAMIAKCYHDNIEGKFISGMLVESVGGKLHGQWGIAFEFNYDATTFALKLDV